MCEELTSTTYEKVEDSAKSLIQKHVQDTKSFGIPVPEEEKALPFIYSIAKQHKNPVSERFIVSNKRCTTKQLSKTLLKVFQLVSNTLRTHCRYKCKFLDTKAFWIINNSSQIHKDIEKINLKRKAKSIYSYDFTQLYTNIPHDKLRESMNFVLEEAFKVKDGQNSSE